MNPATIISLAITAIDQIISLVKHVQAQSGLTTEQIAAQADAQDLQNKADIKALLAL